MSKEMAKLAGKRSGLYSVSSLQIRCTTVLRVHNFAKKHFAVTSASEIRTMVTDRRENGSEADRRHEIQPLTSKCCYTTSHHR